MTPPTLPLGGAEDTRIVALADRAQAAAGSVDRALELAAPVGAWLPCPGGGATLARWQALAAVAAVDLTVARVLEPHLDALAILDEAGIAAPDGTWGVFAAETPSDPLRAEAAEDGYRLRGTKRWCSLAGRLDRALVTAQVDGGRRLFDVDLRHPDVHPGEDRWVARGLAAVTSGPCHFDGVPATPVGGVDWYLRRPGFDRGGMGVAACWFGATTALRATLVERSKPDDVSLMLVGRADRAWWSGHLALLGAAAEVDCDTDDGLLAARTTAIVAAAAEEVISCAASGLGPEPLCFDETHARRVSDLQIYLRQHHAERALVAIGRAIRS